MRAPVGTFTRSTTLPQVTSMLNPLRPAPTHAPRPHPTDEAVLTSAIAPRLAQVRQWMEVAGATVTADDAQLTNCIAVAMKVGGTDPFRSGLALSVAAGFPTDFALTQVLAEIAQRIPEAHRDVTRVWVVENGLRLPCKDGDEIEWLSPHGEPRAGKVVACDNAFAAVAVEVAADGGQSSGVHVRVLMERIFANRSQARFDPEVPVLGQTYADAPAMAAANPGRASDGALTGTSPGVNLNDFAPKRVASMTPSDGPTRAA